jgi:hypothetical protein
MATAFVTDDLVYSSQVPRAVVMARGAQLPEACLRGEATVLQASQGGPARLVLDFGADKTSTSGTFTIQFPTADLTNAILRIA